MAEPEEDKPQTPKNEGLSNTAKTLAGAVAIVISAAGTFGTATGGLAFLLRNRPVLFGFALSFAAVGAGFAAWATLWIAKKERKRENPTWIRIRWLAASAALLSAALVLVISTQASLARSPSRPVIKAEFSNSTNGALLKVTVDADALTVDDQLLISVTGGSSLTFYWGSTGADRSGHASQGTTMPVPLGVTDSLLVSAAVLTKKDLLGVSAADVFITCDGSLYGVYRHELIRRLGHPACVVIKGVPMSVPTDTRSGGA